MNELAGVGCIVPEDLSKPGTHVLVIGVSHYDHGLDTQNPSALCAEFGISNLTSAARSASRIANWLLQRNLIPPLPPLASLRVLLSPIEGELDDEPVDARLSAAPRATRANVEEAARQFQIACQSHRDNHAVVYVAGHGIRLTKNGALLLLEDFGADDAPKKLHAAVDMISLHDGLDHENAAKQQCWFVDVCREKPEIATQYMKLPVGIAYDVLDDGTSVDSSPLLMATATGAKSYALVGGYSLFCDALLWALDRGGAATGSGGASDRWHVSFSTLCAKVPKYVEEVAQLHRLVQKVDIGGKPTPGVFHVYDRRPTVKLTISLTPDTASSTSKLQLMDRSFAVVYECASQWPASADVDAGLYSIHVTDASPHPDFRDLVELEPPAFDYTVRLQ